jgi:hypothetical protein
MLARDPDQHIGLGDARALTTMARGGRLADVFDTPATDAKNVA